MNKKNVDIFAVAGNPILHSKSPFLFNDLLRKRNEFHYTRILPKNNEELIYLTKKLNIKLLNVTSPFKETVIPFLDKIDGNSKKINAINTIINDNNKLFGFNTDWIGCLEKFRLEKIDFNNKNILIVGSGSAASACIFALKKYKVKLYLTNRTNEKALILSQKFKINFIEYDKINNEIEKFDIIISTINERIINNKKINENLIFIDSIYYNSKNHNICTNYINGCFWLFYQGYESYKIFSNKYFEYNIVDFHKLESYKLNNSNIILTGFMGTGKTTIGKILAEKLNYTFIDIDDEIERKYQKTIKDIFISEGEYKFREFESNLLESYQNVKNAVISTGGGIFDNKINQDILFKLGIRIFLFLDFESSFERIIGTNRPLLNLDINQLKKLYENRLNLYLSNSDLIIYANDSIDNVVNNLYNEIENLK